VIRALWLVTDMMWNYYAVWKALEELMGDLKEKGIEIPAGFLTKLKAVHGNINILKADPTYEDTMEQVEEQLNNLEGQLIYLAENGVSPEYADEWIAKVKEARESESEIPRAKPFSPGVPRAHYWIRLTIGDIIDRDELEKMTLEQDLSIKEEGADTVIVHGERSKVKALVKEITLKTREKTKRA